MNAQQAPQPIYTGRFLLHLFILYTPFVLQDASGREQKAPRGVSLLCGVRVRGKEAV